MPRIGEDPDAGIDRFGRYRAGDGVLDDDPGLVGEVEPCWVRTLSNKVMAASTQARIDSRSSHLTAMRASPLRSTNRAARDRPSSSSSW